MLREILRRLRPPVSRSEARRLALIEAQRHHLPGCDDLVIHRYPWSEYYTVVVNASEADGEYIVRVSALDGHASYTAYAAERGFSDTP